MLLESSTKYHFLFCFGINSGGSVALFLILLIAILTSNSSLCYLTAPSDLIKMIKIRKETLIKAFTCCFRESEEVNRRTVGRGLPLSSPTPISCTLVGKDNNHDQSFGNNCRLPIDVVPLGDDYFPSGYTSLRIEDSFENSSAQSRAYDSVKLCNNTGNNNNGQIIDHTLHGYTRLSRKNPKNSPTHQIQEEKNSTDNSLSKIEGNYQKPPIPVPFSQSQSAKMLHRPGDHTSVIIAGSPVIIPKEAFHPKVAMLPPARNNRRKSKKNTGAGSSSNTWKDKAILQASSTTPINANLAEAQSKEENFFESDYYELEIDFDQVPTESLSHYSALKPCVKQNGPVLKRRSEYDYNLKINNPDTDLGWCKYIVNCFLMNINFYFNKLL